MVGFFIWVGYAGVGPNPCNCFRPFNLQAINWHPALCAFSTSAHYFNMVASRSTPGGKKYVTAGR